MQLVFFATEQRVSTLNMYHAKHINIFDYLFHYIYTCLIQYKQEQAVHLRFLDRGWPQLTTKWGRLVGTTTAAPERGVDSRNRLVSSETNRIENRDQF